MHWASSIGASDYVELLLKIGAKIDLPDIEGKMPLHWAVCGGQNNEVIISFLLQFMVLEMAFIKPTNMAMFHRKMCLWFKGFVTPPTTSILTSLT